MLLAATLVVPFLGRDIFDVDEAATMISACAGRLGPCSPAEAVRASSRWPDQTWGLAIVFSQWGQLVGWSEFAIRALPWLVGPLTIAWLYRLGREMFSPAIARTAVLLLATSVLFLTYMHTARFYGPAMLFTTMALWGYWRVALAARLPDRAAQVALLTGATGLLYSHYFSAFFIPALGLFHVLCVNRGRRWWQSTALLALATLLALPQVPDLQGGIAFNQDNVDLHRKALHADQVLVHFLRYLSGDLLHVPDPLAGLPLLATILLSLWVVWQRRRGHWQVNAGWYLTLATVLSGFFILAANEWLRLLSPGRIRYLAGLWPPATLLLAVAVHHLARRSPSRLVLVPVAFIAFSGAANFLWEGELRLNIGRGSLDRVTVPVVQRIVAAAASDSLLLVDHSTFGLGHENRSYELYTDVWGDRRLPLYPESPATILVEQAMNHRKVWLLYLSASEERLQIPEIVSQLEEKEWVQLLNWRDGAVTLRQLRSPP